MKLVKSADVRLRLGLPSIDTIVAAADNAAEEATLHLQGDLRTALLQASYSDVWLIRRADWCREILRLKLTAGFVQPGWQIGIGCTVEAAQADSSITDLVQFDATLGTITCIDVTLDRFVSCRYTAGFPAAADPNTDGVFDLTKVPDWMQKAAELKSIALMAHSPEFANKDGQVIDGKSFETQYGMMIDNYIRYTPDARLPLS